MGPIYTPRLGAFLLHEFEYLGLYFYIKVAKNEEPKVNIQNDH